MPVTLTYANSASLQAPAADLGLPLTPAAGPLEEFSRGPFPEAASLTSGRRSLCLATLTSALSQSLSSS